MKLENIELSFDNFASEMSKLKNQKHFDYLVTIIGEDFGEEGLGCIYILENTDNNEPIVHASNYGERMVEEEADLVPPQILGMLPGLEYFARISGGLIMKGRIPILVTPEELEAQKNRK